MPAVNRVKADLISRLFGWGSTACYVHSGSKQLAINIFCHIYIRFWLIFTFFLSCLQTE